MKVSDVKLALVNAYLVYNHMQIKDILSFCH
jgi:hypothetical protein